MSASPRLITSLTNDRVKAIRALDMRKERKETGLFVAEGASIIITAREHGFVPVTLVYRAGSLSGPTRELIEWALREGTEVLEVTAAVLEKLAAKDNPQTLLAVFRQRWGEVPSPSHVPPGATWLALEEIRDPGNLGTIVRTVDAVGASGILLVGTTCDPFQPECIRATMGSIFSVPLVRLSREDFLAWRADWPGDVVGTHLSGKQDFRTASYRGPTLLVMGSEGPGLSESLTRSCTKLVKIPMAGRLDSLNLAIATALSLYELRGPHLKL
jgi:RNA methyltransferase, TrmH family